MQALKLGLRVDVDTLRGTRQGVPGLLRALDKAGARASFFFSMGPDNMGRNLWRMLSPTFLKKMLRSSAPSLYGWDILLMGTAWPGPLIGPRCKQEIRATADAGHEIGVHSWDHFTWQHLLDKLSVKRLADEHQRAHGMLTEICGKEPVTAAAPGWRTSADMLAIRDKLGYRFASDCRGDSMFLPEMDGRRFSTPQVPAVMPTFDELIGEGGVSMGTYNEAVLGLIRPDALNVYTIHAEVEGIACADLFDELLKKIKERDIEPVPLGALLPPDPASLPRAPIQRGLMTGRAGWVSVQKSG